MNYKCKLYSCKSSHQFCNFIGFGCATVFDSLHNLNVQAIANLSVDLKVSKAVAEVGGIDVLSNLARSTNKLVAEEAAGGLWNLSVGEDHKVVNKAFA